MKIEIPSFFSLKKKSLTNYQEKINEKSALNAEEFEFFSSKILKKKKKHNLIILNLFFLF